MHFLILPPFKKNFYDFNVLRVRNFEIIHIIVVSAFLCRVGKLMSRMTKV